jgi:type I site-specific restriction endonuclease
MEIAGSANVKKVVKVFDCMNGLSVGSVEKFIETCHRNGAYPVIISTYKSCGKLHGIKFDLIMCDEGHNVTGETTFADVMDSLDADAKRIFVTATPKLNMSEGKARNRGMNNTKYYGEFIYTMSFKRAVGLGFILPIRRLFLDTYGEEAKKDSHLVDLVIKTMNRMKEAMGNVPLPNKVIFVFNTVTELDTLEKNWEQIYHATGAKVFTGYSENETFRVNGAEPQEDGEIREAYIKQFKKETGDCILAHVDTMGEGVDVPGITGCILFGVSDIIRIIQNIGRAMRVLPSDRNLPREQRVKKFALLGMVSYNGEVSGQDFINNMARAMQQMSSDNFYNKYLTTHITDPGAGKRQPNTGGDEPNPLADHQTELLGFESDEELECDLFDDGDLECDTVQSLDLIAADMEKARLAEEQAEAEKLEIRKGSSALAAKFAARMKK